jgi:hypothetical protein
MIVGIDRAIGRAASLGAAIAGAALLVTGCEGRVPLPVRAASMEGSACRDALPPEDEARALESTTVLEARAHIHENACNGACQVFGVYLVVRPPEGVTPQRFARMLRCHNLRVLDGEVSASRIPDDPYGLPDTWLDLDVTPWEGNLLVTLSGDHVSDTLRILHRAKAYAAAHGAHSPYW